MRRKVTAAAPLAALALALTAVAAFGYWTVTGGGSGSGTVDTLGTPGKPSVPGAPVFNEVGLSWSAATAPGSPAVQYGVQRSVDGSGVWGDAGGDCPTISSPSTATSCTDEPATANTYVYRVRAIWKTWTSESATSDAVVVAIDNVAPTTTDDATNAWTNQDVSVTLTANDDVGGSGVDATYYTTDGSTPSTSSTVYSGPISITTQGTHVVKYFSVDNAGNVEAVKTSAQIRIDKTAPTVTVDFPADSASYTAATWLAGCSTAAAQDICGTAVDTGGSGLDKVELSIRRNSDNLYWNGSSFASASEQFHTATGTSAWSLTFNSSNLTSGVSYTVKARAVDVATNDGTDTNGFTFTAATCSAAPLTLTNSDLDTYIDQDAPSSNNGASQDLYVTTENNKNRRTLIRFAIGSLPANCQVASATLTMRHNLATTGRTLQVYRAGATWSEASSPGWPGPALGGTPATAVTGSNNTGAISWTTNVAALVQAMYTSGNFGFVIKDLNENNGSKIEQKFNARNHGSTKPSLTITFGNI
jgi:hypothetical protein